ncbi:MAG: YitT family protein [Candidatus Malihini olakiniferum]
MDNVVATENIKHTHLEDVLALLISSLMVSLGIILLRQSGALTGGTAGMAFLLHYITHISFGTIFFLINLPFYYLAVRRMGWHFTIKTFCVVGLVSVLSDVYPLFVYFDKLQSFYATLFGNIIIGLSFILLFRYKASLDGVNILTLYLQDHYGIRAGKFQMALDVVIVLASLFVVSIPMLVVSILVQ